MKFMSLGMKAVAVLITYCLLVVVISYLDYVLPNRNRELLDIEMTKIIQNHKTGTAPNVDLSQIDLFLWDRVYIFSQYTEPLFIDSQLGLVWMTSRYTGIDSDDSINLLVFTHRERVAQYLIDKAGWFTNLPKDGGYAYNNAQFVIDEKSAFRHLLKWVPNP